MFDSGCVLDWHLLSAGDEAFASPQVFVPGVSATLIVGSISFPCYWHPFQRSFCELKWFGECCYNPLCGHCPGTLCIAKANHLCIVSLFCFLALLFSFSLKTGGLGRILRLALLETAGPGLGADWAVGECSRGNRKMGQMNISGNPAFLKCLFIYKIKKSQVSQLKYAPKNNFHGGQLLFLHPAVQY